MNRTKLFILALAGIFAVSCATDNVDQAGSTSIEAAVMRKFVNTPEKAVQGELIIYVDDDALVDSDYIRIYAEHFATHPETMAAGGPIEPLYETQEPSWMSPYTKALLTAWMNYGDKVREYPQGRYPGGGNAAYR